jgi:glycosyltransferase involved in cell wall biosynthesis
VRAILNGTVPRETANDGVALRRELGVPEGVPLIGAIGDLEGRKGYPFLLDAFRKLALDWPDARLVVIGAPSEPDEVAALRRQAADPSLGGRALLPGYIPRAWRFASTFDVCVMPSLRFESFGMSALDAMWAGKPVVASRTGGLPEVVADGETGIIVPPGNADALAEALRGLLASPEKARRMGEAGRRRAAALFTSARMAAEYRAVLLGPAADGRR